MAYPYRIVLSAEERAELRSLVGAGTAPARTLTRARILLKADHSDAGPAGRMPPSPGPSTSIPAPSCGCGASSCEGLPATLHRKRPDRIYDRRLDGEQEAHLVARPAVPRRRVTRAGVPVAGRRIGAPGGGGDDLL